MELRELDLSDLFGIAIKTEMESRETYEKLFREVSNPVAKERFRFLSEEEKKKHEDIPRLFFHKTYAGKELKIPEKSPIPLQEIRYVQGMKTSEIIEQAMEVEISERNFYLSLSKKAEEEGRKDLSRILNYLSSAEKSHYHHILEGELEAALRLELYDKYLELLRA